MTTWLTVLTPDRRRPQAAADLADADRLHRRIMQLFPAGLGERPRQGSGLLFRVDEDPRSVNILLQSGIEPDPGRLPDGYAQARVRTLDPLLDALRPGLPVRYRLVANATRKLGHNTKQGAPLTIVPLHGADAEAWWARKAPHAGLEVRTLSMTPLASALGKRPPSRFGDRVPIPHARTRFDGTAQILDADRLRAALIGGIGRAKSYGCGLLTIAPGR
jgi:CRISPR system Cascade subunit CasE